MNALGRRRKNGDAEAESPAPPSGASAARAELDARIGITGRATASLGGVADSGVRVGDTVVDNSTHLHLHASPGELARPWYQEFVRGQFWVPVGDRAAELAELAEFCVRPEGPDYAWWQAGPYAGKTALLAYFVLDPPAGVQVAAFFVTSRFAGQDDREGFTASLLEQLAAILGQPAPSFTARSSPVILSGMYEEAAAYCRARGRRLVLVVDGLDEDAGLSGPRGNSIAALLPPRPPHGMRVVVSGRHLPGVPYDVAAGHPLRDPGVVRVLAPSQDAMATRDAAESELVSLVEEDPAADGGRAVLGREIAGFMTVARGPLAASDLAQLTGGDLYQVERLITRTVRARSFTRVVARVSPGTASREAGYVLSHGELVATASRILGPGLPGYVHRLRIWAESFEPGRARGVSGWQAETPDYVLSYYPGLLDSLDEDDAFVSLALDEARHDLMYQRHGNDLTALTEIARVLRKSLETRPPDLELVVRLVLRRGRLQERLQGVGTGLLLTWSALGQLDHAIALARSRVLGYERISALAQLAQAAAAAGHQDAGAALALQAEQDAHLLDPGLALSFAETARAWLHAGNPERSVRAVAIAEDLARSDGYAPTKAWELTEVAQVRAELGDHEHALLLAAEAEQRVTKLNDGDGSITRGMARVARTWASLGRLADALRAAGQIEDLGTRARSLVGVADLLASGGSSAADVEDAAGAALAACIDARGSGQVPAAELARILSRAGHPDAAVKTAVYAESAHLPVRSTEQSQIWAAAAETWWALNVPERAAAAAEQADAIVRETATEDVSHQHLACAAVAWAYAGNPQAALRAARDVGDAFDRYRAFEELAGALARTGEHALAVQAAGEAELAASRIPDARKYYEPGEMTEALAEGGMADEAMRVVQLLTEDHDRSVHVFERLARAHMRAGNPAAAERTGRMIETDFFRTPLLAEVAEAYAAAGDLQDAARLAEEVLPDATLAGEICCLGAAWAAAGDGMRAAGMAALAEIAIWAGGVTDEAEAWAQVACVYAAVGEDAVTAAFTAVADQAVGSMEDAGVKALLAGQVVQALTKAGALEEAERRARLVEDPERLAFALHPVAAAWAAAGSPARAAEAAATMTQAARSLEGQPLVHALCLAAAAWMRTGNPAKAAELIGQAEGAALLETDPGRMAPVLWPVIESWAELGMRDRVADLAPKAEQAFRIMNAPGDRELHLHQAARAWWLAGDRTRARVAAREADRLLVADDGDPIGVISGLCAAAETWALLQDSPRAAKLFAQAEKAGADITTPADAANGLYQVASSFLKLGLNDQAARIARKAEMHALTCETASTRADLLALIIGTFATAGSTADTERVAAGIEDTVRAARGGNSDREAAEESRSHSLLAEALAAAGAVQAAWRTAGRVQGFTYRAEAFAAVARAAASAGDKTTAGAAAGEVAKIASQTEIDNPWIWIALLNSTLAWRTAAGSHVARALEPAEHAARGDQREFAPKALTLVSLELARGGLAAPAETMARMITDPAELAETLAGAAAALAAAGKLDEAEKIYTGITGDAARVTALASFSRAWAARDETDRAAQAAAEAERLARTLQSPARQATALVAVAFAFIEAAQGREADLVHAELLLSEAVVLSDLVTALAGIARIKPYVASLVIDAWEHEPSSSSQLID